MPSELPDAPEEPRSTIGKAVDRLRSLNQIVLIAIAVVTAALLGLAIATVIDQVSLQKIHCEGKSLQKVEAAQVAPSINVGGLKIPMIRKRDVVFLLRE